MANEWSRRRVLQVMAKTAQGIGLARMTGPLRAMGQVVQGTTLPTETYSFVVTTESQPWQQSTLSRNALSSEMLNVNVTSAALKDAAESSRGIDGFGACFNEVGWTSLLQLTDADRNSVMRELFHPEDGARFTYCRMPIGCNDFATEAYSYDEVKGDFALKSFSIGHDEATIVPFIQAALRYQPDLKLWASPWTPPSWMKRNAFYAEAKAPAGRRENGIKPNQIGREGEDMFIVEPAYLNAYARYFGRFIDAYQKHGIRVGMVMPQNEFNSAQYFPSCTWTPEGLNRFLTALLPEMDRRGVEVFLGTLERGNPELVRLALAGDVATKVKGVGVQWAGKNAIEAIRRDFPQLKLYQTEQECGDGTNSWSYANYTWQLMKEYLRNGAQAYMYWNISTLQGGASTWGWRQNSLVSVDAETKTFRLNHDFYFLKHLTRYVEKGAKLLQLSGTGDDTLGFLNPDGSQVLLLRNPSTKTQNFRVQTPQRSVNVELKPASIATLVLRP